MAANALTPCVARSSATMVLTTIYREVLDFHDEKFQAPSPSQHAQCCGIKENANILYFLISNTIQHIAELRVKLYGKPTCLFSGDVWGRGLSVLFHIVKPCWYGGDDINETNYLPSFGPNLLAASQEGFFVCKWAVLIPGWYFYYFHLMLHIDSLAPESHFTSVIFKVYRIVTRALTVTLLSGECHSTSLMRSQHWFR